MYVGPPNLKKNAAFVQVETIIKWPVQYWYFWSYLWILNPLLNSIQVEFVWEGTCVMIRGRWSVPLGKTCITWKAGSFTKLAKQEKWQCCKNIETQLWHGILCNYIKACQGPQHFKSTGGVVNKHSFPMSLFIRSLLDSRIVLWGCFLNLSNHTNQSHKGLGLLSKGVS